MKDGVATPIASPMRTLADAALIHHVDCLFDTDHGIGVMLMNTGRQRLLLIFLEEIRAGACTNSIGHQNHKLITSDVIKCYLACDQCSVTQTVGVRVSITSIHRGGKGGQDIVIPIERSAIQPLKNRCYSLRVLLVSLSLG